MAIVAIVGMHWGQFLALFGLGDEPARFGLVRKAEPLPMLGVAAVFAAVVLFEFLPYLEELARGLVANRGALVPPKARQARR
jgi:hypothetical protein